MEEKCILLDTSFLIRFLNDREPLHQNTFSFYQHFLEKGCRLKCSTISVGEYCVKGKVEDLPLKDLELLPYNLNHAVKAGEFANLIFDNRGILDLGNRLIIPNDNKLFAQAHVEKEITSFATADKDCIKIYDFLNNHFKLDFEIINIREPYSSVLGILPFNN